MANLNEQKKTSCHDKERKFQKIQLIYISSWRAKASDLVHPQLLYWAKCITKPKKSNKLLNLTFIKFHMRSGNYVFIARSHYCHVIKAEIGVLSTLSVIHNTKFSTYKANREGNFISIKSSSQVYVIIIFICHIKL